MEVTTIEVAREQANEQYRLYSEAVKKRKEPYLNDMKVLFGAMRRGKVVLDVWQSFRETGLDANGDPKIAIAKADWKEVRLRKLTRRNTNWGDLSFQAIFSDRDRDPHHSWSGGEKLQDLNHADDVTIPKGTWEFPIEQNGSAKRERLRTLVPLVPVAFLPPHGLSNYHILWEVEKWDVVTPPGDPMLLKRVSPNMFVVLATWELSDLEKAVNSGAASREAVR